METEKEKLNFWKELLSFIKIFIIALILIIPVKYFIAEPYLVSGASMSQSFETGHYLIVNKLKTYTSPVERGTVLVFVPPHERSDSWWKYSVYLDPRHKYIKRAIGLPGETIKLENHEIYIKKPGETSFRRLTEPYIKNKGTRKRVVVTLENDEYFMLGDNRANSYDSEEWGPIKKSDIIGEPVLRLIPLHKLTTYPEKFNF